MGHKQLIRHIAFGLGIVRGPLSNRQPVPLSVLHITPVLFDSNSFIFFKENPFLAFFTSLDCKIHRSDLSHFCFFHCSPWILAKITKANWRTGLVQGLCTQPKYNRNVKLHPTVYKLRCTWYCSGKRRYIFSFLAKPESRQ